MALAIVTANRGAGAARQALPVRQFWQHRVVSGITRTALCPLLHGNDLGLSVGPNLSRANLLDAQTGLDWSRPGDTIYTTLTIKMGGKGRGGQRRWWQATTHSIIFIVLHTLNKFASINVVCPRPRPTQTRPHWFPFSLLPARWRRTLLMPINQWNGRTDPENFGLKIRFNGFLVATQLRKISLHQRRKTQNKKRKSWKNFSFSLSHSACLALHNWS